MYGLADCNNFFVSCERAFQPELEGRAVVVLSNNDGVAVARSNEAKAMSIKMGTPFFQLRPMVESGALVVRSSNYKLYGDLSARVMNILRSSVPKIEIYSIDEAYLHLEGIPHEKRREFCAELVRKVRRGTGIPVSIGIAPTKTLCKVANHFAKRYPGYRGVCAIDTEDKRRRALELTPIGEVWGVGWRGAPKLRKLGVETAADLVGRPEAWIRSRMGVGGVKTWLELHGTPVIGEETDERRQSICTSRSFAELVYDKEELKSRVSDFAAMCAKKLRKDGSVAGCVSVFLGTNRFRDDLPQYTHFEHNPLKQATNSTISVVGAAVQALERCWREGYGYKRAGVVVTDIVPEESMQGDLFEEDPAMREREAMLSELIDRFDSADGQMLKLASQNEGLYSYGIRREHCSKLFTSDWNELMEIH